MGVNGDVGIVGKVALTSFELALSTVPAEAVTTQKYFVPATPGFAAVVSQSNDVTGAVLMKITVYGPPVVVLQYTRLDVIPGVAD